MIKICMMSTSLLLLLKMVQAIDSVHPRIESARNEIPGTSAAGALVITVQPSNQTDCKGNKATFAVVAAGGTGTLHYLWRRKRISDISFVAFGASDSTKLPVYNIGVGSESPDGTLYQVTVSDQNSQVVSNSAFLTVNQITGIAPVGVATYTLNQGDPLWLKVLTSGNLPSAYQWIKKYGSSDWRDLTDNSIISGSQGEQLSFTGISIADSGIYKVRVTFPTLNGNQCVETSAITRKVTVIPTPDLVPPYFFNLTDEERTLCMQDLEQAVWSDSMADILPVRLNFYQIDKNSSQFDLSPSHFADNVTSSTDLILHWSIISGGTISTPIIDVTGTILENRIGQISLHPENIRLERFDSAGNHYQIIFWLEDKAGNLTPETGRHRINLTVAQRPQIISDF